MRGIFGAYLSVCVHSCPYERILFTACAPVGYVRFFACVLASKEKMREHISVVEVQARYREQPALYNYTVHSVNAIAKEQKPGLSLSLTLTKLHHTHKQTPSRIKLLNQLSRKRKKQKNQSNESRESCPQKEKGEKEREREKIRG